MNGNKSVFVIAISICGFLLAGSATYIIGNTQGNTRKLQEISIENIEEHAKIRKEMALEFANLKICIVRLLHEETCDI